MANRTQWITIAVDDALKEEIASDAGLALDRRGLPWQHTRLRLGVEHCMAAGISLFGLFALDWPAEPVVLYMVLSVWSGIAFDAARLVSNPRAVHEHAHYAEIDDRFWRGVGAWRSGAADFRIPHERHHLSPAIEVAIAVVCAIFLTAYLSIELARLTELGLLQRLLARPDTVLILSLMLAVQYGLEFHAFRKQRRTSVEISAMTFMPLAETVVFLVMFFIWMVTSSLYMDFAGLFGAQASAAAVPVIFATCVGVVLLLRGVGEIREVRDLRRTATWLHNRLAALGSPPHP